MRRSYFTILLIGLAGAVLAQNTAPPRQSSTSKSSAAKTTATTGKAWIPPKTAWGDPDLQGLWPGADLIGTPLERPATFGERATLTEDEFAKKVEHAQKQEEIDTAAYASKNPLIARGDGFLSCDQDPERCRDGVRIGPPNYWDERGKPNKQASLIVDPPNGRIPPLTTAAQKSAADRTAARGARSCASSSGGCHDSWEDESLWDRCITRGLVGSVVPNTYNQGNQIVQAPGYVVFRNEMIHESRIIPLDGRPHLTPVLQSWMGDSRGHWEGNALLVETTNFRPGTPVGNTPASAALVIVERFELADVNTLNYRLTVNDPNTWMRPWTIAFPLSRDSKYTLFEYACHEGNYYMYNALAGARSEEKGRGK